MVERGQRYRKVNGFLRDTFGGKVYRVGLRGGFTCPNRDGTKGEGGCLFCNPASSEPLGYRPGMTLSQQLAEGVEYIRERHEANKFIAFLSDYTATYGEVGRLEELYRAALDHPEVVGLALGTRPDCLSPRILDLLEEIARETFLWVELGIQSATEASLAFLERRHTVDDSRNAIVALRERGIAASGHVILGLPGEGLREMMATARFLGESGLHGVKIHNLHIVKDTPLEKIYMEGGCRIMELDEYAELAVRFLEHLPSSMVIQRVSGEAPRRLTVAPSWSVNKLAVVNAIQRELERRDTWQGRALGCSLEELQRPVALRY